MAALRPAQISKLVHRGMLLSDNVVNSMVLARLHQPDCRMKGYLLDGFPRTRNQANMLVHVGDVRPEVVVELKCGVEEAVKRMRSRRIDPETGKVYNINNGLPDESVAERLVMRTDDEDVDVIKGRIEKWDMEGEQIREVLVEHGVRIEDVDVEGKNVMDVVEEVRERINGEKNIVLAGGPGSGKGTVANGLEDQGWDGIKVGVGDMIRHWIKNAQEDERLL